MRCQCLHTELLPAQGHDPEVSGGSGRRKQTQEGRPCRLTPSPLIKRDHRLGDISPDGDLTLPKARARPNVAKSHAKFAIHIYDHTYFRWLHLQASFQMKPETLVSS